MAENRRFVLLPGTGGFSDEILAVTGVQTERQEREGRLPRAPFPAGQGER